MLMPEIETAARRTSEKKIVESNESILNTSDANIFLEFYFCFCAALNARNYRSGDGVLNAVTRHHRLARVELAQEKKESQNGRALTMQFEFKTLKIPRGSVVLEG